MDVHRYSTRQTHLLLTTKPGHLKPLVSLSSSHHFLYQCRFCVFKVQCTYIHTFVETVGNNFYMTQCMHISQTQAPNTGTKHISQTQATHTCIKHRRQTQAPNTSVKHRHQTLGGLAQECRPIWNLVEFDKNYYLKLRSHLINLTL